MKIIKRTLALILSAAALFSLAGCPQRETPSSDKQAAAQQEAILQEGVAQTGMPNIKNFRERKTLKMIYELRDQEGLATYTYLISRTGATRLLCPSIGFAINDATGYTNPDRIHESQVNIGYAIMPQAEPNALFTPDNSTTNWVVCVSPDGKLAPIQMQTDFVTLPFKLPE